MVLGLAALLGAVALTLDIGMAYHERRGLQNAVDAAALAGAIELPSSASLAETKARAWAAKNGITDKDGLTVTISNTYIPNDTITVSVSRHVPYYFSALLGIKGGNVPATGRARVGSPAGMNRFVPLAVQQTTFAGLSPGAAATLKYDSHDATKGNSLALAFPGSSGANDFRHDIYNGSTQTLCVSGQEYPGCSSTTSTEPGGMTGPTKQGIDDLVRDTSAACDTYAEVFKPDPGNTANVSINASCNPFPPNNVTTSKRIIIIPVIDQLCSGRCDVRIVRFALFFVDGIHCNGGQGTCDVTGYYAKTAFDSGNMTLGKFDGDSGFKFARLVP